MVAEVITIALLGSAGAGKTTVATQLVSNSVGLRYNPTTKRQVFHLTVAITRGGQSGLVLEDNPGSQDEVLEDYISRNSKGRLKSESTNSQKKDYQEYEPLLSASFDPYNRSGRQQCSFLVVFDINDDDSWQNAEDIIRKFRSKSAKRSHRSSMLLIGNKADLSILNFIKSKKDCEGPSEVFTIQQKAARLCKEMKVDFWIGSVLRNELHPVETDGLSSGRGSTVTEVISNFASQIKDEKRTRSESSRGQSDHWSRSDADSTYSNWKIDSVPEDDKENSCCNRWLCCCKCCCRQNS